MLRSRMALTVGTLVLVVVAALITFAAVLVDSQGSSRDAVEGRLTDRAKAGATLISSVFASSARSGQANLTESYGGPTVSTTALQRQAQQSQNRFLAVAEPDGTILAATPGLPRSVAATLARRPAWVRAAAGGRALGASSFGDSAARGTLSFAQGFRTRTGAPRLLVSGADPKLLAEFFGGSLAQLPAVRGGRTYMIDAGGRVLASPDVPVPLGTPLPERGLLAALVERDSGELDGGRYFVSRAIAGTPWRVAVSVPRSELFASVEGWSRWGPWALFAAFALASLLAFRLALRTLRDATRIASANARLEEAGATLQERAALLARSNADLERVNAELERSNAELDRFASIASHDLREPLRKVQMFSERLLHHERPNLSERGQDYLGRMDAAATRMQSLIDGLLAYARVGTDHEPRTDVDLEAVAREVAEDLDAVRRQVGGEIVIGALPEVAAEPLRMRQLLQNLISNGLRFGREGVPSVVRVSGEVRGGIAVIEVSDNGIGFEPHHAERMFELFERLHPRGVYPGTGMGLALCRRIAERHGGSITATGTPGAGATFTVRLPVAAPVDCGAGPAGEERLVTS